MAGWLDGKMENWRNGQTVRWWRYGKIERAQKRVKQTAKEDLELTLIS